ncbi:MAG: hypothetical protein ACM3H9_04205 [Rhodospirillaceae bacterium]
MRGKDPWSLVNALILSAVVIAAVAVWVFVDLGGWSYYGTPLRVRGYAPQHRLLKPTGAVAHPLGVVGLLMMTVPVIYAVRKRWSRLARAGSMRGWLEVHIFCGIVGPALITLHTSFKFNGIISVAYWSMVVVMLSGFVGRYLFVRIPKTIRGTELTHDEIRDRAQSLKREVESVALQPGALERLRQLDDELERVAVGAALGAVAVRWRLRRLGSELRGAGVDRRLAAHTVEAMAERLLLLRKLARLNRTKRLFSAWHVFHQPLVYVMFAIAVLHVGLAIYLGYAWW